MKIRMKLAHMRAALVYAELSYAKRRKVGCVIVKDDTIVIGYNGTPPGWDNNCEDPATGLSLPEVIHAEQNALDKLVRSNVSSVGASVFITTQPCIDCAKRLLGAQVAAVYYRDEYRNLDGVEFLRRAGIPVEKLIEAQDA